MSYAECEGRSVSPMISFSLRRGPIPMMYNTEWTRKITIQTIDSQ